MKLKSMKLKNFRSYKDEINIEFDNLTAFVGKNDVGKSSILEALDIFFNEGKGVIKIDKDDVNKQAVSDGDNEIIISVCFEELPENIVIDDTNETSLQSEYLLNSHNQLEIIKKYPNGGKEKIFVKANHPTNKQCKDLLQKKDSELREIIDKLGITCSNKNKNAVMRTSIWEHFSSDLQLAEFEIEVTKGDTKSIWEKLQNYLPLYSLFQSDRKNSDGDSEIQDPLKEAVKQILSNNELKQKFNEIALEVETKLQEVADRTLNKLKEMNPEVANSLNPVIPSAENLKWPDVFKNVTISGDEDIPINKRGSGVKRLVLLNFFRAEAERRKEDSKVPSIIYAFEEPETSQHTEHQKILIRAFLNLAETNNTQVIITTHSAVIVKELKFKHLRLVTANKGSRIIESVNPNQLPYPSLNEVNFLAFSEVTEEYHNELYGFIEAEGYMNEYKNGQQNKQYFNERKGKNEDVVLTEYIRHQIHHPENKKNDRFTFEQLKESVNQMRVFIQTKMIWDRK
jgi:hypothetical protein